MARLHAILLLLLALLIVVTMGSQGVELNSGVASSAIGDIKAQARNPYRVPLSGCPNACNKRCSGTSKRKPCMFFCTKCCATCLCVPPGTYGNKQVCPCYNNWKTQQGGPKCP